MAYNLSVRVVLSMWYNLTYRHGERQDSAGLGRRAKEDQGEQQVGKRQTCITEGQKSASPRMEPRWRSKGSNQQQHPPHKRRHREQNGQVSQDSDTPEIVGRDGWVIWAQ